MSGTMFPNYDSPEHHLAKRRGLTAELRKLLFDTPKEQWGSHNNYWRGADMWQGIHRSLLHESGLFVSGLENLLDMPKSEMDTALRLADMRHLGGHLVGHAHVHHHVEDDHYFPRFKEVFPQLGKPIDLLDCDHRVLEETLDAVEGHVRTLFAEKAGRDEIAAVLEEARKLDRILTRHLEDEEDIVIPALLKGL
ncbi:MAG TPA: hemerythrin domain-containing protein [Xanthobacteraceae bacterium]|nr:hemerythrin domain-containing protein [Xanthobacteraceae bacterium]